MNFLVANVTGKAVIKVRAQSSILWAQEVLMIVNTDIRTIM
jgi:hypothetical protein